MIYGLLNGGIADILNQSEAASVWFFSGILLITMGMYVTELYFSSPTDTLSNSISLILVLLGKRCLINLSLSIIPVCSLSSFYKSQGDFYLRYLLYPLAIYPFRGYSLKMGAIILYTL